MSTAEASTAEIDMEKAGEFVGKIFGYFGGAMASAGIYLGDRMGFYKAMAGAGPITSAELAAKTDTSERWVREWLSQQAAAGLIDHRGGLTFELSPEGALALADESTPMSSVGFFGAFPAMVQIMEALPESFRTGLGRKYDAHGAGLAAAMERGTAPSTPLFTDVAVPGLAGMTERLEAGAKVADIGCGSGGRLVALARRYPNSVFHGYDISELGLARARENARAAGATNVFLHNPESDPLPADASFDLVSFGDVVHDLARPDIVMDAVRKSLKPDGTMLVIDFAAGENLEENLQNPMATMFYGISQLICMSSSLSEPDGMGIGTLGLSASLLRKLTEDAGFTRFGTLEVPDPMNTYYEIRP